MGLLLVVAASTMLINGCSPSDAALQSEPVKPGLARWAVDVSRERCPDLDPRTERVFAEALPPPPASKPLPDGRSGLDDDAKREWIDRHEAQIVRTQAAGRSVAADYKRCKGSAERGG